MDETFSFLIHSVRLINSNKASEDDLDFLFELILSIDDDTIINYSSNITIPKLGHDYFLLNRVSNFLLKYYEEKEEYEKCQLIKEKIDHSERLINHLKVL